MDIEARLANLETALAELKTGFAQHGTSMDCLLGAIQGIADEDRKNEFMGRWGPKVAEIEADHKILYGDKWNEAEGMWNFVESRRHEPGFDETAVIDGYINYAKQNLARLKGKMEDTKEAVEDSGAPEGAKEAAESHLEMAENAVGMAEEALEAPEETGEEAMANLLGEHPIFRTSLI